MIPSKRAKHSIMAETMVQIDRYVAGDEVPLLPRTIFLSYAICDTDFDEDESRRTQTTLPFFALDSLP